MLEEYPGLLKRLRIRAGRQFRRRRRPARPHVADAVAGLPVLLQIPLANHRGDEIRLQVGGGLGGPGGHCVQRQAGSGQQLGSRVTYVSSVVRIKELGGVDPEF